MGIYTDSIVSGIVGLGGIVFTIKKVRGLFPSNGKPDNGKNKQEIKTLREVQIAQGVIIQEHEKQLRDGKQAFEVVRVDIGKINTNIGILLDRSNRRRGSENAD